MRRLLAVLVVLGCAAGLAVAFGGLTRTEPAQDPRSAQALAPSARSARDFAVAACVRVRLAEQGVLANARADTVQQSLAEARTLAGEAARRDPVWLGLSGGVAALDEAVRRNDGTAAGIGLRSARAACVPR